MPRFNDGATYTKLQKDDIVLMGDHSVYGEILAQNLLVEDIERVALQTLITNSELVRGKYYRISNAVSSTLSLLVQALTANTIAEYAYNTANGETYKYDITADTAILEPNPIPLGTANQLLGMNAGATEQEYKTLSGTNNQVTVTHGVGGITLSLPQNIHTGATPTFAGLTLTSALTAPNGGTGQSVYAVGYILFASTTTALSRLAGVATGNALISGGVNTAPSWGKIGLTTHVSGTLGVGNGGTGLSSTPTNGQIDIGNGTGFTRTTLTGTANQVTVTNGAGSITLNLPQSIATTSSPTFANLTLSGFLSVPNGRVYGLRATFGADISDAAVAIRGRIDNSTGTNLFNIVSDGTIPSTATNNVQGFRSSFGTAVASFTLSNLNHFIAVQQAFGAGSTVTTQTGFNVDSSLIGAGTNYGFRSQLPVSGTARWNFYGDGTAPNAFVGQTIFGSTTLVTSALVALSSTTQGFRPPVMTTTQKNAIASPTAGLMVYDTTLNKLCVYTTAWETITSV